MAAFTALAIGIVAAGASIHQGKKATKAQKRANEAQRKINKLKNFQAKRSFLRNFRQTQAAALSTAIAQGVGLESSGVQGTRASEQAQKNTALIEFKRFDELGGEYAAQTNKAADASFNAGAFASLSSLAMSFSGSFKGSPAPTATPTKVP
jgi:hypothetical protein